MIYRNTPPNNPSKQAQKRWLEILSKAYAFLMFISVFLTVALLIKHLMFAASITIFAIFLFGGLAIFFSKMLESLKIN